MDSKKDRLRSAKGQAVGIGQETKDEGTEGKGKDNTHNRDLNSKSIFDDPVLCAQFFRDNFDVSLLKEVQPEDIDDISERFLPYLGTELESDSVKKVRILDIGRKRNPPFFVSLIVHKSLVDYDVPMQLLRYMVCIWTEYRREKEAEKEGSTQRKGFRYPIIMPVVYYEGKARWTADMHLRNRIGDSLRRPEWIPGGAMAVIGANKPSNLIHVVINNGAHETVGGMPTVASSIDFVAIAKSCGYPHAVCVGDFDELDRELENVKKRNELCFIEVKCAIGARDNLGRPTTSAIENKRNFMGYLASI